MRRHLIPLVWAMVAAAGWAAEGPVRAAAVCTVADPRVEPGLVGVLLTMEPGWHVYWRNPGASGMPTEIAFDEAPGVEIGGLRWPVPRAFPDPGGGMAYGYSGEVMLLAPVRPGGEPGRADRLAITASWLACKELCVLGEAELELPLPVPAGAVAAARRRLGEWERSLPRPAAEAPLRPVARAKALEGGALRLEAWLWWERDVARVEWFPLPPPGWTVQVDEAASRGRTTRVAARLAPERSGAARPRAVAGVVAAEVDGRWTGWELALPLGEGGGA